MARRSSRSESSTDEATRQYQQGVKLVSTHPIFRPLYTWAKLDRHKGNGCPADGWAFVESTGAIHLHPTRLGTPPEWSYIIAHCLLHLGFGHFRTTPRAKEWNTACDAYIAKFLLDLKFGKPPEELRGNLELGAQTEERLYNRFCDQGVPNELKNFGTAGAFVPDMVTTKAGKYCGKPPDWEALFASGLAAAATSAVNVAGGVEEYLGASSEKLTPAQRARSWFINSYPLLGAMAAAFELVEEPEICNRMDVSIAAVHAENREIYINPQAALNEQQCRFVMAHEFLHVGLQHEQRRRGRDPFLWNVACDYVINGWLIDMEVGEMPGLGLLFDSELKGMSAESVYDRIATDMRRARKLRTLRGNHEDGDMLSGRIPEWWSAGEGVSLDEFYRRALLQGFDYHQQLGRGFLPAELIEEIRALSQPPIRWDVELAQWFDHYFPPLEKVRSYARPSRRPSSTPDIPRPRYVPLMLDEARTFGVVLDTSGSMQRQVLAKALGAIASYSISRDVPLARVVFCDALPYDQGFMSPDAIAGRVKVKGFGGTVLQPGIDLLHKAKDFPEKGPLLIITDGACDILTVRREHAYLLPEGRSLPFPAKGKVFYIS